MTTSPVSSRSRLLACAAAEVPGSSDGALLVFGTVLPYHADGVAAGTARAWSEFHRVTPLQGADWRRLRSAFPAHRLAVAGDMNQSRDGRRWSGRQWYGTRRGRAVLDEALRSAGLVSVTDADFVATGELRSRSSIDHICVDAAWAAQGVRAGAWETGQGDGVRLSDHNGVWADLAIPGDASAA